MITNFVCPNAGVLAPKAVFDPKAGGGAEEAGAPNPKVCCGAPNVNANRKSQQSLN